MATAPLECVIKPFGGRSRVEAERRQVTVVFTDMVGFTSFAAKSGEEATFALVRSLLLLMGDAVHEQGGVVQGFTGDGIMAIFGAPVGLEDAPLRACRAALSILQRLTTEADDLEARHGIRPQLRIGVNTGPAVVGSVQLDSGPALSVHGDTVNVASRLQALAKPGTVCISEATHRLVCERVAATPLGQQRIKGKAEPLTIYRLDAVYQTGRFEAAIGRGLSAFVGRKRELEALNVALGEARSGLRVIDIVAEAGLGKSRLIYEFRRQGVTADDLVMTGNCSSESERTAFCPFLEIFRRVFSIDARETERGIAQKLQEWLTEYGLYSKLNLNILLRLFGLEAINGSLEGLDGVLAGLRTRELLRQILEALSRASTVVMVIEDLQWIDSASNALLAKIIDHEARLRLLLLLTRRPDYAPTWLNSRKVSRLSLPPLAPSDIQRLAQDQLAVEALPETLGRQLADRADGNPLFAEEIVSFLEQRGMLRFNEGGKIDFDAAAMARALPESIQSLLAARVDRLEPRARAFLQAASVVGRRFDPSLLAAAVHEGKYVDTLLAEMQSLDLIRADSVSNAYVFRHALVADALYQGLLSDARQELHLAIADEIERLSGNRLNEVAELLAHHYVQTRNNRKAFQYLVMAGRKCLGVYSLEESANHFQSAVDLLDKNPSSASDEEAIECLVAYTRLLNINLKLRSTIDVVKRYLYRIASLGDDPRVVLVRHNYMFALLWNTLYRDASSVQQDIWSMAARLGDSHSRAYALAGEIQVSTFVGPKRLEELEVLKRNAIQAASESSDSYIQIWARYVIGWEEIHRGRINDARDAANDLIKVGESLKDPRAIGFGLYLLGWIALIFGSYAEALDYCEQAMAVAITPLERNGAINVRGCALILLKRIDEGVSILNQFRDRCVADGDLYSMVSAGLFLALSRILKGNMKEGIRFIEETIRTEPKEGNQNTVDWYRGFLAELYLEVIAPRERQPALFLLKNLPTLMRIMFIAPPHIRASMMSVLQNPRHHPDGFGVGRAQMILGLLHQSRRKKAQSIQHLTEARRIMSQFGPSPILARIDSALAALQ
jgi:class 3 adenylate cyclase